MILLVDNRDSYTFNLAQLIASVAGETPLVVPADEVFTQRIPARIRAGEFSHLVISPGPGTPAELGDFAGSRAALEAATEIPVLGVCLGHQGLGMLAGATVDRAPRARHGFVSHIAHSGEGIFQHLPQDFAAVRYHSLHVRETAGVNLRIHARSEDGVVMGLEVPGRPHWGVQFHPESILTEHGAMLIRNFLDLSPRNALAKRGGSDGRYPGADGGRWTLAGPDARLDLQPESRPESRPGWRPESRPDLRPELQAEVPTELRANAPAVMIERIDLAIDCAATFARLQAGTTASFWLDSAAQVTDSGRYSVLGTNRGSLARTIRYRVGGPTEVLIGDRVETVTEDVFDYLDRALAEGGTRQVRTNGTPAANSTAASNTPETSVAEAVPFIDGFLGYLGYECKALTIPGQQPRYRSDQPDAYWIQPQAHIVVDHDRDQVHLVVRAGEDSEELLQELRDALQRENDVGDLHGRDQDNAARPSAEQPSAARPGHDRHSTRLTHNQASTSSAISRSREQSPRNLGSWRLPAHDYAARIHDIKSALLRGDSYEICLTDTFEAEAQVDGLELYRELRRQNPVPYAAYFRFQTFGDDLEILSASPERFLLAHPDRTVESKPIKGTAPRASDPGQDAQIAQALQADPKTRAENLMIVDLLRNDLGRVCEIGSVEVPALMQIESYATVHQLVSTIRGKLRQDLTLIDLLRATFPGGSMTGAPKARTLDLIDQLEAGPRGIYSGTLGYLGRDGGADLNIVIRSIVKSGDRLQLGAGGAIVLDSDAQAEIDEKNLKAAALIAAIKSTATTDPATIDTATIGATRSDQATTDTTTTAPATPKKGSQIGH